MIEREKRLFETRSMKFDKLKRMIENKKVKDGGASKSRSNSGANNVAFDPLSMTDAFKGKTSFRQVSGKAGTDTNRSRTILKHQSQSQKIFASCSEYLEKRLDSTSVNREIGRHEKFLSKLKQQTDATDNKAPPIVLRSLDGFHEEQHAIYKQRSKYEGKNWGEEMTARSYESSPP